MNDDKKIYDRLNNVRTSVLVLENEVDNINESLHKIEVNHLPHIQKDIKELSIKVTDLKINQAVLITKVTAVVAIAVAVVEFVLKFLIGI